MLFDQSKRSIMPVCLSWFCLWISFMILLFNLMAILRFFSHICLIKIHKTYIHWLFIFFWACITVDFHCGVCDASPCIKPKKLWVRTHKEKQCWWEMTAVKCWCMRHWYYKLWQVHCALQTLICWPKGHADKKAKLFISIKVMGMGTLQIKGRHQAAFLAQRACQ